MNLNFIKTAPHNKTFRVSVHSSVSDLKRVTASCYYRYLLLGALQFILLYSSAQQQYSFIHYDESILPQTTIGNIQQDENGYLWMNTQFGIVRFDGETVRVFTTDNLKGLTSNRIRICAKGVDGSVYFVDENNVIVKVKSPNQFQIITTSDCIKDSRVPLYSSESNNDFTYLNFNRKTGYAQLADSLNFDLKREFLKSYAISEKEGYLFYVDLQQQVRLCYYDGKNYIFKIQSDSFKPQHTFKLNNLIFSQTGPAEAFLFQKAEQKQKIRVTGLASGFAHAFKEESPVLFFQCVRHFFLCIRQTLSVQLKG